MPPADPLPSSARPPGLVRLVAAALLAVMVVCVVALASDSESERQVPLPYVWRDVAAVHLLCAVPLAWLVTSRLYRRLPLAALLILAAVLLLVGLGPLAGASEDDWAGLLSSPWAAAVVRVALAFCVALSVCLAGAVLAGVGESERGRWWVASVALATVALLLVPWVHVRARCRHDGAKLGELVEQSRIGEARALARGLLALDARQDWHGQPLREMAAKLDDATRALEQRVAAPLPARATTGARLERARTLAMLGRTTEAAEGLAAVRDPAAAPVIDGLLGTIRQSEGDWGSALRAYRSAEKAWEAREESPERTAGLVRAATGIAYCERKRGRYKEAEAAYLRVYWLSPTADSHFLLAQFYEDSQQAGKALEHAHKAIDLDPARYRLEGEKLIRKLTVHHFSCLLVYLAENDNSGTTLAAPGEAAKPGR